MAKVVLIVVLVGLMVGMGWNRSYREIASGFFPSLAEEKPAEDAKPAETAQPATTSSPKGAVAAAAAVTTPVPTPARSRDWMFQPTLMDRQNSKPKNH